jgi:hypothetical protein
MDAGHGVEVEVNGTLNCGHEVHPPKSGQQSHRFGLTYSISDIIHKSNGNIVKYHMKKSAGVTDEQESPVAPPLRVFVARKTFYS